VQNGSPVASGPSTDELQENEYGGIPGRLPDITPSKQTCSPKSNLWIIVNFLGKSLKLPFTA
jgi:hypothetical protein